MALVLSTPAWAQQPPSENPPPARASFDLRSDSIQQIVRATAAMQYASAQVAEQPSSEERDRQSIRFVPPVKDSKVIAHTAPRLQSKSVPSRASFQEPSPEMSPVLASILEIAIDEILDTDSSGGTDEQYNKTLGCGEHPDLMSSTPSLLTCPGRYPKGNPPAQ